MKKNTSSVKHAAAAANTAIDDTLLVAQAMAAAAEALGLKRPQLASTIGVSEPTLSRLRRGQYGIPEGKPLELSLLLIRIYRALYAIVGGNTEAMQHWIKTPNRHLGEQSPVDLMQKVDGIGQVLHYLDAMRGRA